jgi:accessory gene regulator protein AgrB
MKKISKNKERAIFMGIIVWFLSILIFQTLFNNPYISFSVFLGFLTYSITLDKLKTKNNDE